MKNNTIRRLVKLANDLDSNGFHKQAEEVDKAIWEFTSEDLMSPEEKAHAQHADSVKMRTEETAPAAAASELERTILEERKLRSTDGALPASVMAKHKALRNKFRSVGVGSGSTPDEALAAAKANLSKMAPGKKPAAVETITEGGRIHVLVAA